MKDTLHANGTLGEKNYLVEIKTTNHTVMVDEPISIGGSDQFSKPCTIFTNRSCFVYCNHHKNVCEQ